MQVDPRIPESFFLKTSTYFFFLPFFKYHVVFQDQPKDYIGENGIIDTIDVTIL